MKTIRETIDALEACEKERIALEKVVEKQRAELAIHRCKAANEYWVWQGDGHDHLESLVCPILIPAQSMRERDATERERVLAKIFEWFGMSDVDDRIVAHVYPPPKPETLPAGIYSVSAPSGGYYRFFPEPFTPTVGNAYRRLVYEDEVMGKAEPSAIEQSCCDKNADCHACDCPKAEPTLPTFEEWCEANVAGWNTGSANWYRESAYKNDKYRNVPDDIFDKMPCAFEENLISYGTPQKARDVLKAALLKLGRIRP